MCGCTPGGRPVTRSEPLSRTEPARRAVPPEWLGRTLPYDRSGSIAEQFRRAARRFADRPALRTAGGALTYAELDRRSASVAAALVRRGLPAGTLVPLVAARSEALIVAILGVLRAGAAFVPLDPSLPVPRLRLLLETVAPQLLLRTPGVPDDALPGGVAALDLDETVARATVDAAEAPERHVDALAPAYVMFTSGSTGQPKGVVVPQRAVLRLVCGNDFAALGADETWLQASPLSFDASTLELWAPLLNGGTCALLDVQVPTLAELGDALRRHGVTSAWLTSSLFNLVVDEDPALLAPLRQLLTGGEALSPPHVRRAFECLPATRLVNGYGPTENTTFTCCHTITAADVASGAALPIGRPIANTRVHVVRDDGTPCDVGEPGELCAGGDGVALHYLGRPDLTRAAFVPEPGAAPGARMYRTGDVVHWGDDGLLHFRGRRDDQVKIRGFRIEPGEVEVALRGLDGVRQAAVVVAGEGAARHLVAHVVARDAATGEEALRGALARVLPGHMVPARFELHSALPIGATGKVDRTRLRSQARGDAPLGGSVEGGAVGVVLGVWRELLSAPHLDADTDLVRHGADSLVFVRAAARIAALTGTLVGFAELLDAATPRAMAALVAGRAPRTALDAAVDDGALTGSELLLCLADAAAAAGAYNEPFATELRGALDTDALRGALTALARRHEALRTRFVREGDALRRHVDAEPQPAFHEETLAWDEAAVLARCSELAARPLDVAAEHPLRAHLLRHGPRHASLLLVFHHVAVDDWSLDVLFRDLAELYAAASEQREPELPPAGRASDLARREAVLLTDARVADDLAHWRTELADAPLDAGLPPPGVAAPAERVLHAVRVGFETSRAVARLGEERGAGPFAVWLAATTAALARATARGDVVVGTHVTRRDTLGAGDAVAFALNAVAVRARCSATTSLLEHLDATRTAVRAALRHAVTPFHVVARELALRSADGRSPLQVLFVFRAAGDPHAQLVDAGTRRLAAQNAVPKNDLVVWVEAHAGAWRARVERDASRVDAAFADELAERIGAVVREFADAPDGPALGDVAPRAARLAAPAQRADADGTAVTRAAERYEPVLLAIWRDMLGHPGLDATTSFFSAGGHSLLAIRMLARVERELGVRLSARVVFEAPTVRGLARSIARSVVGGTVRPSCIVTLRADGRGAPLFCLPGVGGHAFQYRELTAHMRCDRPVFGLQLHDLDAPPETLESVAATADAFTAAIRRVRPRGPYALTGYSYGGVLAVEIARRLVDAGEELSFLGLVDTYAPGAVGPPRRLTKLRMHAANLASLGLGEAWNYVAGRVRRRIAAALGRGEASPARARPEVDLHIDERIDAARDRCLRAIAAYRALPFAARVTVFHATVLGDWSVVRDPHGTCGWGPLAQGGVEVVEIACGHLDLFRPPHLLELAARLDDALARAR